MKPLKVSDVASSVTGLAVGVALVAASAHRCQAVE